MGWPVNQTEGVASVISGQNGVAEPLFLLCRARGRLCALPLDCVVETMRPLPVETVASAPAFVHGVSLVRGVPLPVVDLGALLGAGGPTQHTRFLTIRTGTRRVALAVECVLGIGQIASVTLHNLPPLVQEASSGLVSALGGLDSELLAVLHTACLVPESLWVTLQAGKAA